MHAQWISEVDDTIVFTILLYPNITKPKSLEMVKIFVAWGPMRFVYSFMHAYIIYKPH